MALRQVLTYMSTVLLDIGEIIYLTFFTVWAFIVAVFRFIFPANPKMLLENEIILILSHPSELSIQLCHKLNSLSVGKIVLWVEYSPLNKNSDFSSKIPDSVILDSVKFSDRSSLHEAAERCKQVLGSPAVVINIVDEVLPGIFDTTYQKIEDAVFANTVSNFWLAQEFLPSMLEKKNGHFILLGNNPRPSWGLSGSSPYIGSRCGNSGFVQSLRDSIRHHYGSNEVTFTTVMTDFTRQRDLTHAKKKSSLAIRESETKDSQIADGIIKGLRLRCPHVYVPACYGITIWLENFLPVDFLRKIKKYAALDEQSNERNVTGVS